MKQRIVVLSAFLSPFRSGAEAMVEEVTQRLEDTYEIIIITGRHTRTPLRTDTLGKNIQIRRVGIGSRLDKYLFPLLAPLAARALRPSVIHAVLESYAGLALVFCRLAVPHAKRILTLQSTNTRLFLGAMHRAAHTITAISSVLIQRARTFGRTDTVLIPNGIYLSAIRRGCNQYQKVQGRMLFVGRLEQMKGVGTLLAAFAQLQGKVDPTTHLRIVGGGSLTDACKALSKKLGIDTQVTFTGRLVGEALLREYAEAEIFVGLSRSEALGNVFLEARAAGCAVIATNVGGIPDIIQNEVNGLLVPVNDAISASAAMKKMLIDEELRQRFFLASEKTIDQYDWDVISAEYAAVYQKCLQENKEISSRID